MQGFFEESGNRTGNSYEDLAVYWAFNQNGGEGGIRTPGTSFSSYNGLASSRVPVPAVQKSTI
jgi:hypothetical protein